MLDLLAPVESGLFQRCGCRLADVVALLDDLTRRIRAHPPGPGVPEMLSRHGYAFGEWPDQEALAGIPEAARRRGIEGADRVSREGVTAAVEAVTVRPGTVRLDDPTYRRPIVRLGRYFMYDALATHLPYVVTHHNPAEEAARQSVTHSFEQQVHDSLAALGRQPYPSRYPVIVDGKEVTDLDASVVVGSTLLAVDCYSAPWTAELDRGDYKRTRSRVRTVKTKLTGWDTNWAEVANAAPHWLTTEEVDTVLPVVVTAGAEWIDTTAAEYWLEEQIPRICMSEELCMLCRRRAPRDLPGVISVGSARGGSPPGRVTGH